ncbi:MAG: hypothetical protein LJE94_11740 [Deltaproteobacteria bacterium]|nr:hypothetical protein [Deltaproteobacteria bacterium]
MFAVIVCLAVILCLPVCLRAANPASAGDNAIHVTADRLLTDTQTQTAEFIGSVRVVRGDMTIVSDRLKVLYADSGDRNKEAKPGVESIRRIVAEGNVKITVKEMLATTDRAEWSPGEQTIVLTGKGSRIVSGKNTITGSKITLHQADNRIRVEGDDDERVEAQFFSGEKGLSFDQ